MAPDGIHHIQPVLRLTNANLRGVQMIWALVFACGSAEKPKNVVR